MPNKLSHRERLRRQKAAQEARNNDPVELHLPKHNSAPTDLRAMIQQQVQAGLAELRAMPEATIEESYDFDENEEPLGCDFGLSVHQINESLEEAIAAGTVTQDAQGNIVFPAQLGDDSSASSEQDADEGGGDGPPPDEPAPNDA